MDKTLSKLKNFLTVNNPSNLLIISVTSILLFIICVNSPIDPDMWWHLRNGEVIFNEGTILRTDLFSFTKFNHPWTNIFWLSDLFIYGVYCLGGLTLLVIVFALLGVLTYLIIFLISPGPFILRAFLVIFAAISTSPEWTIRPQVISFLILATMNYLIERDKSLSWKKYLWIPLSFLLWANLHGGFIWGYLLLIAVIIGRLIEIFLFKNSNLNRTDWKHLTGISLFSVITILINPNGFAAWKLPLQTINESFSSIIEWSSPNFHNLIMQPFLWFVLFFIASLSLTKTRISMEQLFKTIGFLFLAFLSQRNIPLAVIIITPILITKVNEILSDIKLNHSKNRNSPKNNQIKGSVTLNFFIIILLCLASYGRVVSQTTSSHIEKIYPVSAVEWIKENKPKGNLLNSYNWGGYIIFNLPDYKVFIDGRADLYGKEFISDWWGILNAEPDSIATINSFGINFLLIEPDHPIIGKLLDQNWTVSFQDEISIIITR